MRKQPRINTAPIISQQAIQQGYYLYPLPAPGNGTYATIPVNSVGTLIDMKANAPTANTWYLDFTGVSLSVNYALTITVLITQGASAFNPVVLVNGITATVIGNGAGGTVSRTNAYYYTILCTAPNQYSVFGYAIAL